MNWPTGIDKTDAPSSPAFGSVMSNVTLLSCLSANVQLQEAAVMKSMNRKLASGLGLAMLLMTCDHAVNVRQSSQYGTYVHGVTHLDMGVEGSTLSLATPGHNIVGFERPSFKPTQKQQFAAATGCMLLAATAEPNSYASADQPASAVGDHTDFNTHYRSHCRLLASLDHIDISLADHSRTQGRSSLPWSCMIAKIGRPANLASIA